MNVTGIFVVDKPVGAPSQAAITQLRRTFDLKRVGHCGTLDPLASGVLPVMLGSATRVCDLLMDHEKTYTAGIRLGLTTDSQDVTGEVLSRYDGTLPSFEQFRAVAEQFLGEIEQVPPMYSALKKNGQKLVDLARKGVVIEREPRKVFIRSIRAYEEDGAFKLDVCCSRGTYIRTLCADIGEKLGCGACMESLRRTSVGQFDLSQAVTLEELRSMTAEQAAEKIIPVDKVFSDLPAFRLPAFYEKLYRNGERIAVKKIGMHAMPGEKFRLYGEDGFYAIGEVRTLEEESRLCPMILFK